MLQPKYPGVYTQELPSGAHTITGAPTSVALFVGPTITGKDLVPTRIQSFGDFERLFGGLSQNSNLSYSVLHFFANGGGEGYIVRVPASNAKPATLAVLQDKTTPAVSLTFTALSSGLASNKVFVEIDSFGIGADPYGGGVDKKRFNLSIVDVATGRSERFTNLSTSSTSARFAKAVINDPSTGSDLVKLDVNTLNAEGPQATGSVYKLKALPASFAKDIMLNVRIDVRDAAGAAGSGGSVTLTDLIAFPVTSTPPVTPLEMVSRLVSAINEALRGDPAKAAAMQGVGVEGALLEGGAFMRLQTSRPGGPATTRLYDATVTLADPSLAGATSFLGTFLAASPNQVANPSRYFLGAPLTSGQISGTPQAGTDGDVNGQPSDTAFKAAVTALDTPDAFFNILCLPDLVKAASADPNALLHTNAMAVYGEAARICANKHAFLLVDPFPSTTSVGAAENWKSVGFTFQSNHAAAFFPNIRVDDPLEAGSIRSHPPSGAIAGVMARTDGQVGVWQAPAGVTASLTGVYGPSVVLSDAEHGILNPLGLNVIRQFPIFGTVNFGARTLDGADQASSEWKYIPVRRTAAYILRTLGEGLRWAVMQPNGDQLWAQLRLAVTSFMQGLFVLGAFKGTSPQQAYFVRCDASTTSQSDIDNGIVNIVIGFAPLKPAEFVVVSLRQIVQPSV